MKKPTKTKTKTETTKAEGTRLHVLIARAGECSRRDAERLIAAGEVQVNGKVVTEAGARAREGVDHVRVSGRLLHGAAKHRYYAYHKPDGCVSTLRDPEGRFCIGDVVRALAVPGLYPVGRLDFHTSGLLLLTNDGELAQLLTHPKFHVEKRYAVKVSPRPSREAIEALRAGVRLRGVTTAPAYVREMRHAGGKSWIDVRIREGRNQQIRRMFEAVGARVEKLRREAIGPLELGKLEVGDVRTLSSAEVKLLKEAATATEKERPSSRTPRPRTNRRSA
ncbi:MAG TPA: pseudouridine synthase [Candidatus Limnocylindrales bacterium]|jgi:23S rRNA pseudouridine2605 synthase|nr:pseudouridine synthase [Candidatus Limnocylindrales bacterium]